MAYFKMSNEDYLERSEKEIELSKEYESCRGELNKVETEYNYLYRIAEIIKKDIRELKPLYSYGGGIDKAYIYIEDLGERGDLTIEEWSDKISSFLKRQINRYNITESDKQRLTDKVDELCNPQVLAEVIQKEEAAREIYESKTGELLDRYHEIPKDMDKLLRNYLQDLTQKYSDWAPCYNLLELETIYVEERCDIKLTPR